MSDLDKDGKLDFAEFVIMTHILFTNRKGVPLPTELPKSLIPPSKVSLVAAAAAPAAEDEEEEEEESDDLPEEKPAQPPMMPPKPAQSPMPAGNDPFATTPQERGFYQQLFMQLDKDNSRLLPHDLVIGYHSQSGLPRPVLEKLFTMSDLDKDGKLDFAEFVIMTHILFTNRKGVPLPNELPKSLIPPSKASLVAPAATAEEEKKSDDAFDFGFGAPTQPAPAQPAPTQPAPAVEKKDGTFDFGFDFVAPTQPQPAPAEEKKDDAFDFGFGAPAQPAQPMMPQPAVQSQAQPQPMMPIQPQPAMPAQPAQPAMPAQPAPEPEDSNPDETKDKKYLWLKWCQNRRALKKREGAMQKKAEDIAAKEAVNNELRMEIEEAKECLERKQAEVRERCGYAWEV